MSRLTQLRQHLNFEAHGGHQPGGYSALLALLNMLDDLFQSLEEQENWVRDDFLLDEGACLNVHDELTRTFLEHLINDQADLGPDYLLIQVCEAMGGPTTTQGALEDYIKRQQFVPGPEDTLGDLDDHPF
jgi:hypothetical protein